MNLLYWILCMNTEKKSYALQDKLFKGIVYMLEYFPPDITPSQSYDQFPCVFRYVACHVDQVVDHRPVPAAFYRPSW